MMPVSNGNINQGDLCAVIEGDVICRFETVSPGAGLNLRVLSDNSLVQALPAAIRVVTATENTTNGSSSLLADAVTNYNAALQALIPLASLTEIQTAFDDVSDALVTAGGVPCP